MGNFQQNLDLIERSENKISSHCEEDTTLADKTDYERDPEKSRDFFWIC